MSSPGKKRSTWKLWAILVLLLLTFVALITGEDAVAWLRAAFGNQRYSFAHPSDHLSSVDLSEVHSDLLPSWLIACANPEVPGAGEAARARLARLREAVGPDANLDGLVVEMSELIDEPVENADELLDLAGAWNAYMDTNNLPWHLDANVLVKMDGGFFYAKSYGVLTEMQVLVADAPQRLRVVTRVDHTNVRESYLGQAGRDNEGALVVVDRVRDFALDRIWPLLGEEVRGDLDPLQRSFAPWIRREIHHALDEEHAALLVETSVARRALMRAVNSINERRDCGSRFVVTTVRWDGFSDEDLDVFARYARHPQNQRCPEVLPRETQALVSASETLRDDDDLREALEAMVAWATQGTTVHELRHVADGERFVDERIEPEACEPCASLGQRSLEELSAYLASFAHSPARYASLFQACELDEDGPHRRAVAVLDEVLPGICRQPKSQLAADATRLEKTIFGRSEPIVLPEHYPETLPLSRL